MISPLPLAVAVLAQRARILLRSSSQSAQESGRRVLHLLRDSSAREMPMSLWSVADAWWEATQAASLPISDEEVQMGATQSISCGGPGCNGCCRDIVEATQEEAREISARLGEAAWQRVERWRAGDPCPVLAEDGSCSAYAFRPVACRLRCVVTPREWCDPASGKRVAILSDPVRDSLLEDLDPDLSLPEMLQEIRRSDPSGNPSSTRE